MFRIIKSQYMIYWLKLNFYKLRYRFFFSTIGKQRAKVFEGKMSSRGRGVAERLVVPTKKIILLILQ